MGSTHTEFQRVERLSEREHGQDPERRLWSAVLLLAVQDWRSHNMKAHREAEEFLFESGEDFETACHRAGFDPSAFQSRLKRLQNASLPVDRQTFHLAA
jgi:hypothetical protein